ncbi:hypothetical protein [Deinococcus radiotolerans]|uniref:Uncharacterized protein n=1 Tax=Deinococcus radiotolerans TaxID=1309407 RepID=A0ABQ2FN79_9DEIO|nr:hypothetical protein [Deinococcus radiotolerans]GGL10688.1 hypothetical protein GCM10010844_31670 [Deinococcus radiotolerans]
MNAHDTTDQLAIFVLTGFRFVLPDNSTASEGFQGYLESTVE